MNTGALCAIALAFLSHHVARFDRPILCDSFTAADHDTFVVRGDMPRAWQVVIAASGKPLSYQMPATVESPKVLLHDPRVAEHTITIITPSGLPATVAGRPSKRSATTARGGRPRPATIHLYGGRRK